MSPPSFNLFFTRPPGTVLAFLPYSVIHKINQETEILKVAYRIKPKRQNAGKRNFAVKAIVVSTSWRTQTYLARVRQQYWWTYTKSSTKRLGREFPHDGRIQAKHVAVMPVHFYIFHKACCFSSIFVTPITATRYNRT